jgi:hypothetical protein
MDRGLVFRYHFENRSIMLQRTELSPGSSHVVCADRVIVAKSVQAILILSLQSMQRTNTIPAIVTH